ncbi:MAG: ATP-binding protein [Spirochaetales bacterium]|uniref:AAA family ATPase n=1 Tax=Bullifex sp. TaxID=2815808 RepID=UPI002A555041|nr:ATP-binding protein [Bullifex sp.]MDD7271003.1 ATP-binding protein [Spirochaetales bacterium]MDY4067614.1 ATP-binding protein [Bullifex sp.]
MRIIGREREKDCLMQCLLSKKPELVAVYGRRRVGKTYLIKEFFNNHFSFYTTGIADEKTQGQLKTFHSSLIKYGYHDKKIPSDWFEAFEMLRKMLDSDGLYREPINNKRVIFLDELPWMDTAKSDFKSAFEYFWNSYASSKDDILIIVCGSATSWILNNLIYDRKGFHNRITKRIHLAPFSLAECEELFEYNNMVMTRSQMIESYMIFGGVPYYLNLLDSRLSLIQNVEELCFKEYGDLHFEYHSLFHSLFNKPEKHMAILESLARNSYGLTRTQLSGVKEIGGGSVLTKDLRELEECGFIRRFNKLTKKSEESFYQLIDPFVLFSIMFLNNKKLKSWKEQINTPGYYSWRGKSFEIVCLNHITQIKLALGISGIESDEYSWHGSNKEDGAQIDLLIVRKDGVINLCEMKFTNEAYSLDSDEYEKLLNRMSRFRKETDTDYAIHITLICSSGYKRNKYSDIIQNVITGDELFKM